MTLRRATTEAGRSTGLWEDPDWRPAQPGTFAVVIGVSRYDHLPDGRRPQYRDAFGLGQLHVSALTAYRFFEWLSGDYRVGASRPVKCWMLAAPTEAELEIEPALAEVGAEPTFDACIEAVEQWFEALQDLEGSATEASRAIFFFSGHGLEVTIGRQVLLPCDYLNRRFGGLNRALSTENLQIGMAVLPVATQLYFLDACRNVHERLQGAVIEGFRVLDEPTTAGVNPTLVNPVLYASAPGTAAYQPTDVAAGLSLYGQALLEGLRGEAGAPLDCNDSTCSISFFALQQFMKRRVTQLLQQYGVTAQQPIRFGGYGADDLIVTEVRTRPPAVVAPPPVERTLDRRYTTQVVLDGADPGTYGFEGDSSRTVDAFGDDRVAALWSDARLYQLGLGEAVEELGSPRLHTLRRDGTRAFRMVLSLPEAEGDAWLELHDAGRTFATLLPGDGEARFLIELGRDEQGDVVDLRAGLAAENEAILGLTAVRWREYRDGDPGVAVGAISPSFVKQLADGRVDAPPVVAVVTCLLLLRTRRPPPPELLRRLHGLHPTQSDLAVVLAQALLATGDGPGAAEALLGVAAGRLPCTGEALSDAVRLAHQLARVQDLDPRSREGISALKERLDRALAWFRPGDLFTVFTGPAGAVTPDLVLA